MTRERATNPPAFAAAVLLLALTPIPRTAAAAGFSITSETIGQAYELRGRDGLFVIPRSRITQLLFLYGTDLASGAGDALFPKKLDISIGLSLDHDFGVSSASLDPNDQSSFLPLVERTEVGILASRLQGRFGLDHAFTFGLGRLVLLGPAGFVAMDGMDLGLRIGGVLALGVSAGLELVPDLRLSVMGLPADGIARDDRHGWPPDLHPGIEEPRHRPLVAALLGIGIPGGGELTISYRRTWADLDFEEVSVDRLGLGLTVSGWGRPVSVRIRSVFDLVWLRVAELEAEIEILPAGPDGPVGFGLTYLHMLPLFDAGSIFNVFDTDPHDEVGVFVSLGKPLASLLHVTAGASVRITDVSSYDEAPASAFSDVQGWLTVTIRKGPLVLGWSTRGGGGESGVLAGTTLRAELSLLGGRLEPAAGLGLWFWDDPLRRTQHGLTAGGSATIAWRPVPRFSILVGMDVFSNDVAGTGISGIARMEVKL